MAREFSRSFYHSKEWRSVREYVLKRDGYVCALCGKPAREVHHKVHLNPKNIYDLNVNLNPDNLISLCKDCHFEQHRGEHGNGRKAKEKAEELNENEYFFDDEGFIHEKISPPVEKND